MEYFRSFMNSKIMVGAIVVIILLTMALYISSKVIAYKNGVIYEKNKEIKIKETEKEIIKESIPVIIFENNNSTAFKIKKEKSYEEVPDTIGVHTIIFD
ncbi:MAG: hypothetical protein PVI43_01005 [Candidatus Bathyarchaeota archaeon]|jgi:hypothetical protein